MKTSQRILEFVNSYIMENGYSPTVREIGQAVGLRSTSTVHEHMRKLESKGLLTKEEGKPRTSRPSHRVSELEEIDGVVTMLEWQGRRYKLVK